jgi:hypothetical protein
VLLRASGPLTALHEDGYFVEYFTVCKKGVLLRASGPLTALHEDGYFVEYFTVCKKGVLLRASGPLTALHEESYFFWVVCFFACLSVLFYFNLLAATEDRECAHDLNYFFLLRIF